MHRQTVRRQQRDADHIITDDELEQDLSAFDNKMLYMEEDVGNVDESYDENEIPNAQIAPEPHMAKNVDASD